MIAENSASASPRAERVNATIWSVFATFFMNALVLGNWIPRIPAVKELLGLSATQLGLGLFSLALGTLVAFSAITPIVRSIGLRNACVLGMICWSLLIGLVPQTGGFTLFCALLFSAGLSVGLLEVAMNTAADRVGREHGREIMSRAHGFWSVGSLVGALMGTGFAAAGIGVETHFLVVGALSAVLGIIASWRIAPRHQRTPKPADSQPHFKLPPRAMVLLCIMPVGVMLVEGAFIDWSALFVRDVLSGGEVAAGFIYAAFSAVMAATRLSGDLLIARFGAFNVMRISAISATFGIALFAGATSVPVAFVGALFSGLGVAIVYPLAMTAAARRPGNAEDNVAALSLFAFSAFMMAPPAIGFLADVIGLRWGLLLLVPLAATSWLLSGELKKKV